MQLFGCSSRVAIVAALGGYLGSHIARRKERRARTSSRLRLWLDGGRDPA
jgi:hypothetical protein